MVDTGIELSGRPSNPDFVYVRDCCGEVVVFIGEHPQLGVSVARALKKIRKTS